MTPIEQIDSLINQLEGLYKIQSVTIKCKEYTKFHRELTEFVYANRFENTSEWANIKKKLLYTPPEYMDTGEAKIIMTNLHELKTRVLLVSASVSTKTNTINKIQESIRDEYFLSLNSDIISKGGKMAEAYITLYCLENHIRDYIDNIFKNNFGEEYFKEISIPNKIRFGIECRKSEEQSKKWLPLRDDNGLYYLDFIELVDLMINNWDYFKSKIPDQNWIKVKMNEMYDIRCLIAHNSFISEENMQLLDVTTKQIIKQLYI